ncbi:oligopeptide transporter 2-like [Tripterygium wilfordii]|uniref:oligopeptide transporter 2-like n=1 Tax=Tripterygium wilfordii TaxID=458696 RepID=UPI0018F8315E|nr:oligopeptide transporter 2-like [Tripterygium wilfordii]
MDENDESPIEQVRLTVPNTDDPSLPVWTFRMWLLGVLSCALLAFANTFFMFRKEPLSITMISVQVASLPVGKFLASILTNKKFRIRGFGDREFSLNPGPFNVKEHVLISIFANVASSQEYAIHIVTIIKAFYHRKISFLASWILIITTQVMGYGWAGIMRRFVVDSAEMWWPSSLVQVSLFRALHEKENKRMTRGKFFLIALICSFTWYLFPSYLIQILQAVSWVCWIFPKSTTAHQLGSGMAGLGLGSFALDWTVVAAYFNSPLISPFFAIANVAAGYVLSMFVALPILYWGINLYDARRFPIFSSNLYNSRGHKYNVSGIVNDKFEIDMAAYEKEGRVKMSVFFALFYGVGFASTVATITHVALFNGREIYKQFWSSYKGKVDIHTRLMKKYKAVPNWWFHSTLVLSLTLALVLCTVMKKEIQMPWWGLIFAAGISCVFTLPVSIITATTNSRPGLNVITEYVMGSILPGRPLANVCFKTYGHISMVQAVLFLNDFKLGHYMKIPPRSMFLVQLIGTVVAATVSTGVAWWLLGSIENICEDQLLPHNSPWTCPNDHVFFDASVIWGLVGPKRMFGSLGDYSALNWFFLGGALGPLFIWLLIKAFPKQKWIALINIPVILTATGNMPPATSANLNCWIIVGVVFNYFVFNYRKRWWQRYNYVLSAALDAGVAFMGILLHLALTMGNKNVKWWGSDGEHCPLASCPTEKGVVVNGCPAL